MPVRPRCGTGTRARTVVDVELLLPPVPAVPPWSPFVPPSVAPSVVPATVVVVAPTGRVTVTRVPSDTTSPDGPERRATTW